jgi:tRNA(fMet)-specific endonuclease VapC
MTDYLLDTNAVIVLINGTSDRARKNFTQASKRDTTIYLSAIVLHELRFGIANSARPGQNTKVLELFLAGEFVILPFTADHAAIAAEARLKLKRQGTPIGPYDLLIAAQGLALDATVVTADTREFSRVEGLKLIDWSAEPRRAPRK